VDERDIAADREALAKLHWGGWYEPLHLASFAEKALPHYIARAEEAESACAEMRGALEHFLIGAKHMSCMYKPDDPDPTWHCCDWSEVVEQIEAALSLSPSSVAEYAVNERVGRAVMEFVNRKDTAPSDFTEREKQCYQAAITDVWAVSLNARDEAKARGEQP
jgi:hypothetical protein